MAHRPHVPFAAKASARNRCQACTASRVGGGRGGLLAPLRLCALSVDEADRLGAGTRFRARLAFHLPRTAGERSSMAALRRSLRIPARAADRQLLQIVSVDPRFDEVFDGAHRPDPAHGPSRPTAGSMAIAASATSPPSSPLPRSTSPCTAFWSVARVSRHLMPGDGPTGHAAED